MCLEADRIYESDDSIKKSQEIFEQYQEGIASILAYIKRKIFKFNLKINFDSLQVQVN